jgi:DNA repair exonuclease SbcCD ATPase subunit
LVFNIEEVELDNFRSFRGKHSFKVPQEPGLYLITGINEIEPRLGANGAGKSTLLEAIYWCLYGKTTRGLKAGDVISWGELTCTVTATLNIGSVILKITRTQSPNTLTLNSTPLSQEDLQKHLRLRPEAFTYSVLLPQFGESFFDLLPSAKLTLFSQIMELDYWLEKSEEAKTFTDEITSIKSKKELVASKCEGQIETMLADVKSNSTQLKDFAATKTVTIKQLTKELDQYIAEDLQAEVALLQNKTALKNIALKLETQEKAAKKCPACGQPIRNKDLESLLKNQSDFEWQTIQLERQAAVRRSQEQSLRKAIDTEMKRVNPYAEQIKQKQTAIKAREKQLADLHIEINQLDEEHVAVSFWVNGFKRIRLFIVEQTLRQLEIEVNNNMSSLGLTDWHVEFDVERENKSGGVTKGFVILVYAPGHKEPVRWESFSGGEGQRLRMAGDLGLANLIMERAGLVGNIEFFDEPSRHLSSEGLADMAETLHERALSNRKRIFLVDHHSIDFGAFTGRFNIIKGRDGSRLEYI